LKFFLEGALGERDDSPGQTDKKATATMTADA
jgi:hypothetical protein